MIINYFRLKRLRYFRNIFDALAGLIASMLMDNNDRQGAIANIVVGLIGGLIVGLIVQSFVGSGDTGFNFAS